jgi:hypothetical protein
MSIAVVASTKLGANGGGTTSPNIDTTGATLIVASFSYARSGSGTLSDNKGNTWNTAVVGGDGTFQDTKIVYAANPTVGSGHNFTIGGGSINQDITIVAFSGVVATSPYDKSNVFSTTSPISSIQSGASGVPTVAGSLIIAGLGDNWSAGATIDSSFNIVQQNGFSGGNYYGSAIAWKQSSASENPTWTAVSGTGVATTAAIAVFKPIVASTVTGTAVLGFSGISFNSSGTVKITGSGNLAFSGISFAGLGGRAETGTAGLALRGISFTAAASRIHVTGTGNLAFGGISIAAGSINAGIPGSGLRQFWTF